MAAAGSTGRTSRLAFLVHLAALVLLGAAPLFPQTTNNEADLLFQQAIEQARQQRWQEAEGLLLQGYRSYPGDKRFPTELGGVEFRRQQPGRAKHWLRKAHSLDPADPYINNFLGTLYLLDENLEAALKYWNRNGRPVLREVRIDSTASISPLLIDRALTVANGMQFRRSDLLHSQSTLDAMNLMSRIRFKLSDATEERMDLAVGAEEPVGWRTRKWLALARMLRGLPNQTVYLEGYNIGGSGITVLSSFRWNRERQRARIEATRPFMHNPRWILHLGVEARREEWFLGSTLLHERIGGSIGLQHIANAYCHWQTGLEFNYRENAGLLATSATFTDGLGWEGELGGSCDVMRFPEHRLRLTAAVGGTLGGVWSGDRYGTVAPSLELEWYPLPKGDTLLIRSLLMGRGAGGTLPFDRYRVLGLERDDGLLLRGHEGHSDDRKGRAPVARNFFVWRSELDRQLWEKWMLTLLAGPFLDVAHARPEFTGVAKSRWFVDAGIQVKLRAFRDFGITLIYGRDLRDGGDAFHVSGSGR